MNQRKNENQKKLQIFSKLFLAGKNKKINKKNMEDLRFFSFKAPEVIHVRYFLLNDFLFNSWFFNRNLEESQRRMSWIISNTHNFMIKRVIWRSWEDKDFQIKRSLSKRFWDFFPLIFFSDFFLFFQSS